MDSCVICLFVINVILFIINALNIHCKSDQIQGINDRLSRVPHDLNSYLVGLDARIKNFVEEHELDTETRRREGCDERLLKRIREIEMYLNSKNKDFKDFIAE